MIDHRFRTRAILVLIGWYHLCHNQFNHDSKSSFDSREGLESLTKILTKGYRVVQGRGDQVSNKSDCLSNTSISLHLVNLEIDPNMQIKAKMMMIIEYR